MVKIGNFSRGGVTRGNNQADNHDLGYKKKYIPCGIVDGDNAELNKTFGSSYKASDVIVDTIEAKWNAMDDQERAQTSLIQIKMDNGPESNGRRTQFLYRMVQLADKFFSGNRLRPCDTVRGQRDARTGGVRWIR